MTKQTLSMTEAQIIGYDRLEAELNALQMRNGRYLAGCLKDLGHPETDWSFDPPTRTFYRDVKEPEQG